jgi:ubiquinone/menaquinone biosynthesis C-methylase UbiE
VVCRSQNRAAGSTPGSRDGSSPPVTQGCDDAPIVARRLRPIAELYDSTPHREKSADPELIAFLAGCGPAASLTLLDIACGTGNQQIANRGLAPDARFVGLDGSLGMLRQARRKMPDIAWVHGDSAALPFTSGSFDFISCQYAFHHFRDKAGMLREAFRVLRCGGRFALYNMCPQQSDDWLYYAYSRKRRPAISPISGRPTRSLRK